MLLAHALLARFFPLDEIDRFPFIAHPSGPSDTVEVNLFALGLVIIDYESEIVHVKPSCRDIRGD